MIPSTLIAILKAKFYLGNKWKEGLANDAIIVQEEYLQVEADRAISIKYNP